MVSVGITRGVATFIIGTATSIGRGHNATIVGEAGRGRGVNVVVIVCDDTTRGVNVVVVDADRKRSGC